MYFKLIIRGFGCVKQLATSGVYRIARKMDIIVGSGDSTKFDSDLGKAVALGLRFKISVEEIVWFYCMRRL